MERKAITPSASNDDFNFKVPKEPYQPKNNDIDNKWQILEGLKDGQRFDERPRTFTGYMHKRRKRPLKGWHKRYFHLENGILSYAKSASDMSKKKLHGTADTGLSVISCKFSSQRIDIDTDNCIFHLKTKKPEEFRHWVNALKIHRLARQHEIMYGKQSKFSEELCDNLTSTNRRIKLKNLILHSNNMSSDSISNYLINENKCLTKNQENLVKLSALLKFIELQENVDIEELKYKKSRLKFTLKRKKSSMKTSESDFINDSRTINRKDNLLSTQGLSVSNPLLTDDLKMDIPAKSKESADIQMKKPMNKQLAMIEFIELANEINNNFRQMSKAFQEEQEKSNIPTKSIWNSFDNENAINDNSCHRSYSIDESVLSLSEYYDAEDKMSQSDYSSSTSVDDEDDESVTDINEDDNKLPSINELNRRTKLPSVQPTNDISLWDLLYRYIGKDLSKISMPVTINEPLNLLQRLCEELEYCELLDMAASIDNPIERMLLMAAFAISSYSSSYFRAGHKPFNPLLGETYECIRDDKGFRFISEQVSHHPPISACHADSKNYTFWQDMRVITKFWGKSMEIIPIGTVNVILKPFNSHYQWNKITTCVHNLFKGERYVDIYGELTIKDSDNLTCKITFEKPGLWSSKSNDIRGYISNNRGEIVERLYGKWNESVHNSSRCIWRAGTMPEAYKSYYGFTRFAIELNELTEMERSLLPPTDTRFRPDQRFLEEGNVTKAESTKLELEQKQRERRKKQEESLVPEHIPLWFSKQSLDNKESYIFNNKYWECRENKFRDIDFVKLW